MRYDRYYNNRGEKVTPLGDLDKGVIKKEQLEQLTSKEATICPLEYILKDVDDKTIPYSPRLVKMYPCGLTTILGELPLCKIEDYERCKYR